jgi:glutaryl-CoA dehydrogenase
MCDLLSPEERAIRDRVRTFCDEKVAPIANDYWPQADFPVELIADYGKLGVSSGHLSGHGCPGDERRC